MADSNRNRDAIKVPEGWLRDLGDHMSQEDVRRVVAMFLDELYKTFPVRAEREDG